MKKDDETDATHKYLKHTVSLAEVVNQIDLKNVNDKSELILAVSPCRSGSTVLLRVFGSAGVQAYFQPLKNVLRWLMQGGSYNWSYPPGQRKVFIKETLGPYTDYEAEFNPLEALLKAGFPASQLKIVIIGRNPWETWSSWDEWWHESTNVALFIKAWQTTESVRQQALQSGIPVTTFLYNALQVHSPAEVIRNLFLFTGVEYCEEAIKDWKKLPPFGEAGSGVVLPEEPSVFEVPGIHNRVVKADSLSYFSRMDSVFDFDGKDKDAIKRSGILDIYRDWQKEYETVNSLELPDEKITLL